MSLRRLFRSPPLPVFDPEVDGNPYRWVVATAPLVRARRTATLQLHHGGVDEQCDDKPLVPTPDERKVRWVPGARSCTSPSVATTLPAMNLPPDEFEKLKARVRPEDRHRLRPDGLLEPDLPPMHLCGGLEAPYLLSDHELSLSASQPTSSEPGQPPSSDGK